MSFSRTLSDHFASAVVYGLRSLSSSMKAMVARHDQSIKDNWEDKFRKGSLSERMGVGLFNFETYNLTLAIKNKKNRQEDVTHPEKIVKLRESALALKVCTDKVGLEIAKYLYDKTSGQVFIPKTAGFKLEVDRLDVLSQKSMSFVPVRHSPLAEKFDVSLSLQPQTGDKLLLSVECPQAHFKTSFLNKTGDFVDTFIMADSFVMLEKSIRTLWEKSPAISTATPANKLN